MKGFWLKTAAGGMLSIALAVGSVAASAATGYMSFLLNTPMAVVTGDAASYMSVGRDWSGSSADISGGIAQPKIQQRSTITTSRTSTHLIFTFEIPDGTSGPPTPPLVSGDRVIVQIDPNNSGGAALQQGAGINGDYRYEVTIKNKQIVDFSGAKIDAPERYVPDSGTSWNFAAAESTSATAIWKDPMNPGAGGKYEFTLSIPLSELGNPSNGIGVALAIVNDLGHSHPGAGGAAVHEFTGTAFPMLMGITPTSEPGIVTLQGVASGNWVNPSTWGSGYFSAPTSAEVVFDQNPYPALSYAIRLGNCDATWNQIQPVPSLTGWEAWQQNPSNGWYLYNPPPGDPCRMAIWLNAQVKIGASPAPTSTLTTRRFLVVWGRPGIGGPDWTVAGLTAPVTVGGPETQVNFIWNNPPAIAFTGHPCLKAYVLPADLVPTNGSLPLSGGQTNETYITGIDTQQELSNVINAYGLGGTNKVAQMNFSNISMQSGCQNRFCAPLLGSNPQSYQRLAALDSFPLAHLISSDTSSWLAQADTTGVSTHEPPQKPGEKPSPRVLMMASGFAVADPRGKANYVYVEPIGEIAWAVPGSWVGTTVKDLRFELANPRASAWTLVDGKRMAAIPAPPRRLLVAMEAATVTGMPLPRFDTKVLGELASRPVAPGEAFTTQVAVQQGQVGPGQPECKCSCGDMKCKTECGKKQASADIGPWVAGLSFIGTLGVGSFAFIGRKRRRRHADADDVQSRS